MSKFATVVIPFAYTPRWGQIVISSLKKFKNEKDFDILLMNNSPEHPAIKAIAETQIGEGVKIHIPERASMRWHSGALDTAINMIDTPYMFALETDVTVMRDGWLDWYAGKIHDQYTAMVGWYWYDKRFPDDYRHYINPSATLYRTELLKRLWQECTSNKDEIISYGMNYEKRKLSEHTATMIRNGEIGPFSDSRGFFQVDAPAPRPDKWYQEPGAWIYSRLAHQYECIKLLGELLYNPAGQQPEVICNYYGNSLQEAYVIHHWAGTVSHNYDKHPVSTPWEKMAQSWWLEREFRLWKEWVPEDIREYSIKEGLIKTEQEEIAFAKSRLA
ncbi:MAG: glycosyltransferase [Novosphingobium sp.]|nr:glycosyltransferase [Novosphingobium sp.]